jgi:hypothetical protein
MNERLEQLADSAGLMKWDKSFKELTDQVTIEKGRFSRYKLVDCDLQGYMMLPEDLEKLAHLIIRECAKKVEHILRDVAGGGTMGDEIRELFGIEK